MTRPPFRLPFYFLLILLLAGTAHADAERSTELAEQRLTDLIAAINSDDDEVRRRFVETAYAADANVEELTEQLGRIKRLTGGVDLHGEVEVSDDGVSALVRNRGDQLWVRLGLGLASGLLTEVRLEVTSPPRDLDGPRLDRAGLIAALETSLDGFSGAIDLRRGDDVLFQHATGLASRRFSVPNRLDTRFNLGSMNKMFTAVAIAKLVEAGTLDYDDRLIDHLPDYPRHDGVEDITIHHLLTHTSGFGSYWEPLFAANFTEIRSHTALLALTADQPLDFAPGSRFGYSNTGYVALGRIIEVVTGDDYFDHVREHVFEPAGMHDTDSWAYDDVVPDLATGYTREQRGQGAWRSNVFQHAVKGCAAGGGYATVGDLQRFASALWGDRLVSAATRQRLHTVNTAGSRPTGYGYGFGIRGEGALSSIGHNGGAPGINGELKHYPELDITVAILANESRAATRLLRRVEELLARFEG
ncbi:MAG: serine hydrolase domain-containing protein [Acidobacteriota bacterium]